MELMGDRLTFGEDVAQVLCAKNIPDGDNNDCSNDDDVAKVLCAKNIPDDGGDYYDGHDNDSDTDHDNDDDRMSPRFFVPRTFLIRIMGLFLHAFHFQ